MSGSLPDNWHTVSHWLDEALDLPASERGAWLAGLQARDAPAAVALAAWLDEFDVLRAEGFLEDRQAATPVHAALAGLEVGAYRLLEPIGHGGMGTVWLGERHDGRFEQRVAVKLPNMAQAGPAGIERFAREARILARLTHPQIAHIIDAGVSHLGAPYLVLEYVQGEHIDRFCDARRLGIADRLRLFLDVLAPVAHAHANLVVHRDLKPTNVMVTADRYVKLLDFGIAKLLETDTGEATREGALTLAFAAPEQLTGGAITTSTDVYALGVLLYLLLTGRHPSAEGTPSPAALIDAIVQCDPPKPSEIVGEAPAGADDTIESMAAARASTGPRLRQALSGDLDTIVLKALRKAPSERYANVTAFADDLRRHLDDEPISARSDTIHYRAVKFVRRHRAAVAIAAVAILALVGGLVGTLTQAARATTQARAAEVQRDVARRQLSRAEAINDLNAFLIADAAPLGTTFTARDLLDRAERIVARQQDDADGSRIEMFISIGRLYQTVGETATAARVLQQAYDLSRGAGDGSLQAKASCSLGSIAGRSGDIERARRLVNEGLAGLPDEPQHALTRVLCHLSGTSIENWAGESDRAIDHARTAQSLAPDTGATSALLRLRIVMDLAESYRIAGRGKEANEAFGDAYARLVTLGREDTEQAGTVLNNWALVLSSLGRPRDAEQMFRRVVKISSVDGSDARVEPVLLNNLATTLFDLARYDEGIALATRARDTALAKGDNIVADQALLSSARLHVAKGDVARGAALLDEVEAHFEKMFAPTHPAFLALAIDRIRLAEVRGDLRDALERADRTMALVEVAGRRGFLSPLLRRRAEIGVKLHRFDAARADAERAVALGLERIPAGGASGAVGLSYLLLGQALAGEGRVADAHAALTSAIEHMETAMGTDHPEVRRARELRAGLSSVPHKASP